MKFGGLTLCATWGVAAAREDLGEGIAPRLSVRVSATATSSEIKKNHSVQSSFLRSFALPGGENLFAGPFAARDEDHIAVRPQSRSSVSGQRLASATEAGLVFQEQPS
jgi:hypothetical protein